MKKPMLFFADENMSGAAGDPSNASTEKVAVSSGVKDFAKRFAPPPDIQAQMPQPPPVIEPAAGEVIEPKPGDPPIAKKPGSNVPKILEDKKRAEKERDDALAKVREFEERSAPLEKRITELQAKVDSGTLDPVKEQTLQKQISDLEQKHSEEKTRLEAENARTKKRLEVFDTAENPQFRQKYIQPLAKATQDLKEFTEGKPVVAREMQKAIMLQKTALEATDASERRSSEEQRDAIISAVMDGMNPVTANRFLNSFGDFIKSSEEYTLALADIENTSKQIKQEWAQEQDRVAQTTISEWNAAFVRAGASYESDLEIKPEIISKMKELQIEVNPREDILHASRAIKGELNKEQTVDLLQRGGRYNTVNAKNKAQAALIADLQQQLTELRGARPGGGSNGNPAPAPAPKPADDVVVNDSGENKKQWMAKFKPPTPPTA